jgi:hypothetical protein
MSFWEIIKSINVAFCEAAANATNPMCIYADAVWAWFLGLFPGFPVWTW